MGILSAAVEANGWVLAVTGDWPETSGAWSHNGSDRTEGEYKLNGVALFPLDADGVAKLGLTVLRQGFARLDGRAVASVDDRQPIVATKPLRRPYPDHALLDETDHGDGTRTIRLALSDRVYAGDTVVELAAASGWKQGEVGRLLPEVANHSTRALPLAISRWASPSFTLVRGATACNIDVIVAAHHPRHFGVELHQALAAMKLTATDGTTTKEYWFAGPHTSPDYGDNLRCWGGSIDLSGLSPGPITIHRTEYPWVGAARSTGFVHSTDATNGTPIAWGAPLVVCYDPDGTLYPARHVFVDAAGGTTTPASVTVAATLAGAKAGTAAANISTAVQALYLANFTLPARNGWGADTARAMDWNFVTLAAGVQTWGATAVTSGANCNEGRLVIRGDPADADPRANCIWRSGSAAPSKQVGRFWLADMQLQGGEATFGAGFWHLDNVEVRGKPGFETGSSTGIISGTSPAGYAILSATRMTWWKYDGLLMGSNTRASLLRNCGTSRACEAIVHIGGSKPADPYFPSRNSSSSAAFGGWGVAAFPNTDQMVWSCVAMAWAGRFLNSGAKAGGAGTLADPDVHVRWAVVNCLCERAFGNAGERIFSIGEGSPAMVQDSIWEGNTLTGNGFNGMYNGGANGAPFANLRHIGNVVRNNVFGRHAKKGDIFHRDGTLTGEWEYLFGVGFAGNVHGNQASSDNMNFQFAFFGVGSAVDTSYAGNGSNAFMKFVSDKSDYGSGAPSGGGGGDYRPDVGSPIRARGVVASIDRDIGNSERRRSFASGVLEPEPQAEIRLMPEGAAHWHAASDAGLATRLGVKPRPGLHLLSAPGPALRVEARAPRMPGGRVLRVDREMRTEQAGRD